MYSLIPRIIMKTIYACSVTCIVFLNIFLSVVSRIHRYRPHRHGGVTAHVLLICVLFSYEIWFTVSFAALSLGALLNLLISTVQGHDSLQLPLILWILYWLSLHSQFELLFQSVFIFTLPSTLLQSPNYENLSFAFHAFSFCPSYSPSFPPFLLTFRTALSQNEITF